MHARPSWMWNSLPHSSSTRCLACPYSRSMFNCTCCDWNQIDNLLNTVKGACWSIGHYLQWHALEPRATQPGMVSLELETGVDWACAAISQSTARAGTSPNATRTPISTLFSVPCLPRFARALSPCRQKPSNSTTSKVKSATNYSKRMQTDATGCFGSRQLWDTKKKRKKINKMHAK